MVPDRLSNPAATCPRFRGNAEMRPRIGSRRRSRELALSALYQIDLAGISPEDALEEVSDPERYSDETLAFATDLVIGATGNGPRIDAVIRKYARDWSLDRMAHIDRNILRLSLFELLFLPDIPPSVSVDEAVELAKKYSTAESGRFVNGVLGNVIRNLDEERAES